MEIIELLRYMMFGNGDVIMSVFPLFLIPLIASVASSGISAAVSAKQAKDSQKNIDRLNNLSDNEYLREYYKGLDSTENRAYLKRLDNRMRKSDKAAENSSVATNATHENALATKQKNNEVYDDAVANIVANNEQNKRAAENTYFNRQYSLTGQQNALNQQKAANWINAASSIAQAGTSLGMAYAMDGGGSLFNRPVGSGTGTSGQLTISPKTVSPDKPVKQSIDWKKMQSSYNPLFG